MWYKVLQGTVENSWAVLVELAPWLLIGAMLAGLLHGLAPTAFVRRRLRGYQGVVLASLFGVPLPLCSCAVIPTGLGLRRNGASEGASVGFLISTPQTGVDSVFVTAAFLGWPFALFKWVAAMVLGVVAGGVVEWLERRQERRQDQVKGELTPSESDKIGSTAGHVPPENAGTRKRVALTVIQPSPAASGPAGPGGSPDPVNAGVSAGGSGPVGIGRQVADYLRVSLLQGIEIMRSIYLWILIGVFISAVLNTVVPVGGLGQDLGAAGTWWQSPAALLISVPLYVCATASVPIASALVHGGFSVGAAIIFLMAGPATNMATIGAIYKGFSRQAFAVYLSTVIIGSMVAASIFDAWFPNALAVSRESTHGIGHDHHDHNGLGLDSIWSLGSAFLLLALFGWFGLETWWKSRQPGKASCCSSDRQSESQGSTESRP